MTRRPHFRCLDTNALRCAGLALGGSLVVLVLVACGGGGASTEAGDAGRGSVAAATPDPAFANLTVQELIPILTRYGIGPNHIGVDLIYAPRLFFDVTGLERPEGDEPVLLFVLEESIHDGDLGKISPEPTSTFLVLDDGSRVAPIETTMVTGDPHHRTSRVTFELPAGWTEKLAEGAPLVIRVVAPMEDGSVSIGNTFEWQLPLDPHQAHTMEAR